MCFANTSLFWLSKVLSFLLNRQPHTLTRRKKESSLVLSVLRDTSSRAKTHTRYAREDVVIAETGSTSICLSMVLTRKAFPFSTSYSRFHWWSEKTLTLAYDTYVCVHVLLRILYMLCAYRCVLRVSRSFISCSVCTKGASSRALCFLFRFVILFLSAHGRAPENVNCNKQNAERSLIFIFTFCGQHRFGWIHTYLRPLFLCWFRY